MKIFFAAGVVLALTACQAQVEQDGYFRQCTHIATGEQFTIDPAKARASVGLDNSVRLEFVDEAGFSRVATSADEANWKCRKVKP